VRDQYFPQTVSLGGDINGDGIGEILLGDPEWDPISGMGKGRVHVASSMSSQRRRTFRGILLSEMSGVAGASTSLGVAMTCSVTAGSSRWIAFCRREPICSQSFPTLMVTDALISSSVHPPKSALHRADRCTETYACTRNSRGELHAVIQASSR